VRHEHEAIRRHDLSDRAPLQLVEGKTDGQASIVQPAGGSEDVPQSGHGTIGIAILYQQPRLLGAVDDEANAFKRHSAPR
jgi:hypothetical protein